jgi:hypothetical protein
MPFAFRFALCFSLVLVAGCAQSSTDIRKQPDTTQSASSSSSSSLSPSAAASQPARQLYVPDYTDDGLPMYGGEEHARDMGLHANTDPPTTTVRYANIAWGLSVDIPFNPDWGTENYSIAPYDEGKSSVIFGPLHGCEGGVYCRESSIGILPASSAQAITAQLQKEAKTEDCKSYQCIHDIRTVTMNGLTVVMHQEEGMSSVTIWEVLGKKQRYMLASNYYLSSDDIGRIIGSMKLI